MDSSKRVLLIDKQPDELALLKSYLLYPERKERATPKSFLGRLLNRKSAGEPPPQEKKTGAKALYQPEAASSPEDALKLFSEAFETEKYYSLVVVDMDADEAAGLIKKIWEIDPLVQIMAGSSKPALAAESLASEDITKDNFLLLAKPFEKAVFLQAAWMLSGKYDSARMARFKVEAFEKTLQGTPVENELTDTAVFNIALVNEMVQRKNAEVELQNAKDNLESIFMAQPLALIVADDKGVVQHWNAHAEPLSRIKKEVLKGALLSDAFPLLRQFEDEINKVIDTLRKEELRNVEYSIGESLYFNIFICPLISGETASGIVIMVDDISADHKKDEYLRQAQKMDTVGNLASGIAHDFNNVLGAIGAMFSSVRYSVQTAKDIEKLRNAVRSDLEVIDDAVKHGADMVDQLRSLAKKKELEFSQVDLLQVIEKVIKICRSTFPKSIELISTPSVCKDAYVQAYPSQIEQVLLNLCVNASHAMTIMRKEGESQGGTLTVSLEKVFPGKEFTKVLPGASEGAYYLIRIWDTGIGMTPEVMKKIFDPFFTTKEKKGTGLGLSMVYNIVQQHKGFVEVYSEPGNGSVFNVFLPAWHNDDTEKPSKMT